MELATVRPGQIIKTSDGRYALVRHLQALIVPRDEHYQRPEHVKQIIRLALESLPILSRDEAQVEESTRSGAKKMLSSVTSDIAVRRPSKRMLRIALAMMTAVIVVLVI